MPHPREDAPPASLSLPRHLLERPRRRRGATVGPRLQAGDFPFARRVVNGTLRHLLLRANMVEIWRAAVGGGKGGEDRA